MNTYEVIGVSRELRPDRLTNDRGEDVYVGYFRLAPDYHPLAWVARIDDESRVADITALVRGLAPRSIVRVDTVNDLYAFEPGVVLSIDPFLDIIGRHFKQPKEGLGNDGSPVAHMWRTIAMPDNPL